MLSKHRNEREVYAISYVDELEEDELLSAPALQVLDRGGVDVTTQFGNIDAAVDGPAVIFWLTEAATAAAQLGGVYRVYLRVTTSTGRLLVATTRNGGLPVLTVTA
jgi:hypothetical protein